MITDYRNRYHLRLHLKLPHTAPDLSKLITLKLFNRRHLELSLPIWVPSLTTNVTATTAGIHTYWRLYFLLTVGGLLAAKQKQNQ